ncbi:helix-turn-helix domain-containing protein [uncultured Ramlibacter sp.]|uniref:helix-turn-helix domain-containing protein n=1 Tax=uncultured Ramlibacter sp. TaxID=260755 RepID=UPI00345BE947
MASPDDTNVYPSRIQELAQSLDCFTEEDVCTLCKVTFGTLEAWRKRHKGPAYSRIGNRVLYPRAGVREFLDRQVRDRSASAARTAL